MRSMAFAPFFLLALVLVVACSSSSAIPSQDAGIAGEPCDPSAADPCYPTGDPCLGVTCDPTQHICLQYDLEDAGPLCTHNDVPCATSADCATGLSCGFPAGGGCGAQGQCINPAFACDPGEDAAACGTETPACGCDGLPDPFVVPGYASSPVGSLTPCPDGGPVLSADGGPLIEAGSLGAFDAASE
jgi:hypothetical protein